MSRLRHRRIIFLCLFLAFFFSFSLGAWLLWVPPSNVALTKVIFIKKGMHLREISGLLQDEGVVRSRYAFVLLAAILGKSAKIKAGEYEFEPGAPLLRILDTLASGQVKEHLITIPEGYTLAQIAQLLAEQNIIDKQQFFERASSPMLIGSLGLPSAIVGPRSTLEGYLFPETYHLYRDMDPEEVIRLMVHQFKKVFDPEMARQAALSGMSEREVVILASIIEKETPLPEEKPLISAVFHNRLSRGMPLQSDPTVIYGIEDGGTIENRGRIENASRSLTREELLRPTPYNSYLRPGLPPSPICSPGRDSLVAAIHPAPVSYLYFVSRNNGSHFFSSTYEDHTRAVWKYQKTGKRKMKGSGLDKKMKVR